MLLPDRRRREVERSPFEPQPISNLPDIRAAASSRVRQWKWRTERPEEGDRGEGQDQSDEPQEGPPVKTCAWDGELIRE